MAAEAKTIAAPDGTRIRYELEGEGPALMLTNGLTTSRFFWKYLRPRWREHYTLLSWELPGHADSDPARTPRSASIEGMPEIMASIMDAAGIERATHVGWSVGCQIVLEMYRQQPQRCRSLVTLFGPAERALSSTELPIPGPLLHAALRGGYASVAATVIQRLALLATLPGGAAVIKRSKVIGDGTSDEDVRALVLDLQRLDPATCAQLACSAEAHSARDVLDHLRVPLLIMAGDEDRFAPAERVGLAMHLAARTSTLVRLKRATHTALLDHVDEIADAVEAFVPSTR